MMSTRNELLKDILIASGGADVEETRNGYLERIAFLLGVDISSLKTRNDLLLAILNAYIGGGVLHGDFDNEFSDEFI